MKRKDTATRNVETAVLTAEERRLLALWRLLRGDVS